MGETKREAAEWAKLVAEDNAEWEESLEPAGQADVEALRRKATNHTFEPERWPDGKPASSWCVGCGKPDVDPIHGTGKPHVETWIKGRGYVNVSEVVRCASRGA